MSDSPAPAPSERTRVQRVPDRGRYEREVIDAILDEGLVAHVAFDAEHGPTVIPSAFWRDGDRLLFHGSAASRAQRALRPGASRSVCVTLLDGIVLARSGFHHSMNYRSVVVYGEPVELTGEAEKTAAPRGFTEKIAPGRWEELRPPTAQEMKATAVFALSLDEASAKVREGGPVDEEEDYALDVWAGVVPLWLARGELERDPRMTSPTPDPTYTDHLGRHGAPA
jgi:nitroimidazol reductase NimA-like FMN-containing flavoprotein (pyridoxamine 5'-phosphate oxidase superfamily)